MSSTPTLKPWHFTVEFDECKIKQYGTTVDEVRAAINEIAERNDMEEVKPGTWITKPGSKDWLSQSVTLAIIGHHKEIMRAIKKIRYWEDDDSESDYVEDLREIQPELLVF